MWHYWDNLGSSLFSINGFFKNPTISKVVNLYIFNINRTPSFNGFLKNIMKPLISTCHCSLKGNYNLSILKVC